jgi:hypothetical protein
MPASPGERYEVVMWVGFHIAGDIASFNEEMFTARLEIMFPQAVNIELTVRAASINVDARIVMPSINAAQQAESYLTSIPTMELSISLGVTVDEVNVLAVQEELVDASELGRTQSRGGVDQARQNLTIVLASIVSLVLVVLLIVAVIRYRRALPAHSGKGTAGAVVRDVVEAGRGDAPVTGVVNLSQGTLEQWQTPQPTTTVTPFTAHSPPQASNSGRSPTRIVAGPSGVIIDAQGVIVETVGADGSLYQDSVPSTPSHVHIHPTLLPPESPLPMEVLSERRATADQLRAERVDRARDYAHRRGRTPASSRRQLVASASASGIGRHRPVNFEDVSPRLTPSFNDDDEEQRRLRRMRRRVRGGFAGSDELASPRSASRVPSTSPLGHDMMDQEERRLRRMKRRVRSGADEEQVGDSISVLRTSSSTPSIIMSARQCTAKNMKQDLTAAADAAPSTPPSVRGFKTRLTPLFGEGTAHGVPPPPDRGAPSSPYRYGSGEALGVPPPPHRLAPGSPYRAQEERGRRRAFILQHLARGNLHKARELGWDGVDPPAPFAAASPQQHSITPLFGEGQPRGVPPPPPPLPEPATAFIEQHHEQHDDGTPSPRLGRSTDGFPSLYI